MNQRTGFAPVDWQGAADELGYSAPAADGSRTLNGFALRPEGDWLALVDRGPAPDDPLSSGLGAPGLWRVVGDGTTFERVHDLPQLSGVEEACEACEAGGEPSPGAFTLLLEWAASTHGGACASDWTPPPRDEVESWFTASRLTVRSGSLFAKGELVHEPGRLALVFPELASVSETLSPARKSWLAGLLLDASRRWRLVRIGIDAESNCVRAEVDLSGVPAVWARPFVQLSLEALVWASGWMLPPLSFLVDTNVSSRALVRHSILSLNRSTST